MHLTAVFGLTLFAAISLQAAGDALPPQWKHQDIGSVEVAGSASAADRVFTLKGTLDTWGTNDGFHFVWQPLEGDGEIVARVLSVENTLAHAKGGVMMRDGLGAGAKHAQACVTAVDGAQFLTRTVDNDKTAAFHTGANKAAFPHWVKLVRAGNQFSGYESVDGQTWSLVGSTNIAMSRKIFTGLTASSHLKPKTCTVTMDNVRVTSKITTPGSIRVLH